MITSMSRTRTRKDEISDDTARHRYRQDSSSLETVEDDFELDVVTGWLLLCPDGVHFADCVVQWTELETSRSTFLPGLGRANERGVGLPDFRVFVVRVSFDEREPAGPGARCTRYGSRRCEYGRGMLWGVPFPRQPSRQ